MRIFRVVHLLYGLQRYPMICVNRLIKLCTVVCQTALRIRIKEARKCCLRHSPHLRMEHCHVYFRNHTPAVTSQGNHSDANGILVHRLYGSVQLPDISPYRYHRLRTTTMSTCGASYSKCINPKPCIIVHHTKLITLTLMHFCTPDVRICPAPWRTSPYVYHNLCTPAMSTRGAPRVQEMYNSDR